MYFSSYNNGLMRNPDIVNLITRDFYLAPLSLEQPQASAAPEKSELRQGETTRFGNMELTFLGVDRPVFTRASGGNTTPVTLRLAYSMPGQPASGIEIRAASGEQRFEPVTVQDRFRISVLALSDGTEDGRPVALAEVTDLFALQTDTVAGADADILVAEASVKPFINLVWSGVIILVVGFLVTIVRRTREAQTKNQNVQGDQAST
jgi:cytochrome c-type biogenesis protein CcmF